MMIGIRLFITSFAVGAMGLLCPISSSAENPEHWDHRDELFAQALEEDGDAYDKATQKLLDAADKHKLLKFIKTKANEGKDSRLLASILVHRLSMSPEQRNELLSLDKSRTRPGSAYVRATGTWGGGRMGSGQKTGAMECDPPLHRMDVET